VTGWKVGWAIAPPHFTTALGTIHQFDCFTHGTPLQEAIAVAFEQAEVCAHNTFHIPHSTFTAFLNRVRRCVCVCGGVYVRWCEQEKNYFPDLKQMYWRKRDKLVTTLRDCGLAPVVPKGSYFVMADTSSIPSSVFMGKGKAEPGIGGNGPKEETRDYQFCRWLTRELGTTPARVSCVVWRVACVVSCRIPCVVGVLRGGACAAGVGAIPPSAFFSKENAHIAENFVRFTFCKRDEVLDAAATKLHKLRDLSAAQ
jgi:aspartate/methionine/tyrosine aminotransferase